jgi:DNA-binding transcriptional regulator YhcF (GntR family)
MTPNKADSTTTERKSTLLTKRELAAELRISPRTVQAYCDAGRISFIRLSPRCIRFQLDAVLASFAQAGAK